MSEWTDSGRTRRASRARSSSSETEKGRFRRAASSWRLLVCLSLVSVGMGQPDPARADSPEAPIAAGDLLPFEPRRASFRLRHAKEGDWETVSWSRTPVRGQASRVRVEVPGVSAALLERADDGSIRILSHWDHQAGHRIDYDPPTILLPARLIEGEETRFVSQVVVYDTSDGSREASGKCVHTVRLVGRESLETRAGRFDVVRVDLSREVDVPIAKARVTIELGFVPGRGRVLERTVEELRFFGFVGKRESSVLELVEELPSLPPATQE